MQLSTTRRVSPRYELEWNGIRSHHKIAELNGKASGATQCDTLHHCTSLYLLIRSQCMMAFDCGWKWPEDFRDSQMLGYHNLEGYLPYLPFQMNKNIIKHRSDP